MIRFRAWRRSKYGSVRTECDGILFDSQREADRYKELRLFLKAGAIKDLQLQPKFEIIHNGVNICFYRADFSYFDCSLETVVVEDVKGYRTREYKLKVKMMRAFYGIEIKEI